MSKAGRRPSWLTLELPAVDAARCNGCGNCVAVCPTNCLALGPHLPWLPRPADCVSCGLCVAVCPTEALHLAPQAAG